IIHSSEKSEHASRATMKKQARSIFDSAIALFFIRWNPCCTPPVSRQTNRCRLRYGTCSYDRQRVTARVRRRRAVAVGERRANSRTRTPPKDLTTLTFFFTAAYTRSAFEAIERGRGSKSQERRDGL